MPPPLRPALAQVQEQTQKPELKQVLDARQLQSLRILQKPLQELREDIRAELESNVALEEAPAPEAAPSPSPAAAPPDGDEGDSGDDRTGEDYSAEIDRYEDALAGTAPAPSEAAEAADRHARFVESLADRTSLLARLSGQLAAEGLPEGVRRAGEYLIGSMDSDGRADLSAEDLALAAGVTAEEAREAIRTVEGFDYSPDPADGGAAACLVPEVAIVRAPDGGYAAELLPGTLPALRIDKLYRALAADPATAPEAREYLAEKLRSGEMWIDALSRRNATLLAIARQIARIQAPFFEHGLARLKPMTLAAMGDLVGLDETTVGRAIANKSALTPQGTCPLRLFFTHGVRRAPAPVGGGEEGAAPAPDAADGGDAGEVSTMAVRAAIQRLVRGENPRKPLSDQALAGELRAQGYPVARRTVAKYREQLGIPPSHLRK